MKKFLIILALFIINPTAQAMKNNNDKKTNLEKIIKKVQAPEKLYPGVVAGLALSFASCFGHNALRAGLPKEAKPGVFIADFCIYGYALYNILSRYHPHDLSYKNATTIISAVLSISSIGISEKIWSAFRY